MFGVSGTDTGNMGMGMRCTGSLFHSISNLANKTDFISDEPQLDHENSAHQN